MSKKTFTNEEAAQIAVEFTRQRVNDIAKSLQDLRARELKKALIPPHKHNTGTTSSSGVEDVAPTSINPRGKNDAMKGEMSADCKCEGKCRCEETSGEKSPDDLKKEALCKMCGKGHSLEKGCSTDMDKAMLKDSKGKEKDNGIHPDSVLPEDKDSEEMTHDGSGGDIVKGPLISKAMPPMAKPPSGKNMGTNVPTSVAKEVKEMVVHGGGKPEPAPKGADYEVKADGKKVTYVRKEELDKGAMDPQMKQRMKQHMLASAGGPGVAAPAPEVQLPNPAQHAARAAQFAAHTPPAASTGHRPGIFGRLNKSEKLEKKASVTQPMPTLKPAAAGKHTVGGGSIFGSTATGPSKVTVGRNPMLDTVLPTPSTVTLAGLHQNAAKKSPVLIPRPALKPAAAGLHSATGSDLTGDPDKTVGIPQDKTVAASPKALAQGKTSAGIKPKV